MAKKESIQSYESQKKNFKKIMLTMKKEKGELIQAEAEKENKSLNAFVLDIVLRYIEEKNQP